MIRKDAMLSEDALRDEIATESARDGYGKGVIEAAKRNSNVVVVCADLTESTKNAEFKKQFPDRFIQAGVHEQFLAAGAAGLALGGKIPFIASYAMFCPGRAWEQVRTNICLNDANVKIIGSHAGVSVGADGATHQALEDIAITRVIPNLTVVAPCDAIEARKATIAVAETAGPCYARLARPKTPVFTTEATPFQIGKARVFREGTDVAIVACGPLVRNALLAAETLSREGIDCMVVNNHTIKPMDAAAIIAAAEKCGAIVAVEDHQRAGGMGSRVAEILAQHRPVPMEFIGADDRFGESGEATELIEHFGMGVTHIMDAVKKVIARK